MTKWLLRSTAILLVLVVLLVPHTLADSSGPNAPGSCINDTSYGTTAWTSPGNAGSDNNTGASSFFGSSTSQYLRCTSYGFSIPDGATIDGIVVGIKRLSSAAFFECADDRVRIIMADGTIGSTNKATATTWPTSYAYEDHGGTTDLWGETWTAAGINDSDFGLALSALRIDANCSANVDHIRITVHYTPSAGAPAVQVREAQVIWWQ